MHLMLIDSLKYVAHQNMFWGSMGFTTSIAIFVGVLLYDGNMEQARKGTLALLSYAFMISWTTIVRIIPNAYSRGFVYSDGRPLAGLATIIYITIFWLIGIIIGVSIFKKHKFKL